MPQIKSLNLDSLRPKPQPMPQLQTVVATPGQAPKFDWIKILLICAVVFLGVYILMSRGVIPGPSPGPVIDTEGFFVMLMNPDSESGMTTGQKEFMRSAKIADWVTENGGEFRAYPQSQNIDNEQQVWREIRKELSPPLVVGVVNKRRLTKLEAPNGIEEGIRALERLK
jgi:hypothetical protein